jgi:hypothetical protein
MDSELTVQLNLRKVPISLYRALKIAAFNADVSLNDYCVTVVEEHFRAQGTVPRKKQRLIPDPPAPSQPVRK